MNPTVSALLCCLLLLAAPARAQVYDAATITTTQFAALDRGKTAVIIPGGILEEHGPYLPSNADGLQARWLADSLAREIAAQSGWSVLLLPELTLGHSGANDIGRRFTYPGTITVRASTLRTVYMDLADSLKDQGFRWVFVVHSHGAPRHNQALYDASDYFTDTSGGQMVHLMGLTAMETCCSWKAGADATAIAEDGFSVHAGVSETSRVMFVAPETVDKRISSASNVTGGSFADLVRLASDKSWPGYFGAPRHASAAIGERVLRAQAEALGKLALAILNGQPWPRERFYTDASMGPEELKVSMETDAVAATAEERHKTWLQRRQR